MAVKSERVSSAYIPETNIDCFAQPLVEPKHLMPVRGATVESNPTPSLCPLLSADDTSYGPFIPLLILGLKRCWITTFSRSSDPGAGHELPLRIRLASSSASQTFRHFRA